MLSCLEESWPLVVPLARCSPALSPLRGKDPRTPPAPGWQYGAATVGGTAPAEQTQVRGRGEPRETWSLRVYVWTVAVGGAVAEVMIRSTVALPSAVYTTAWLQGGPHGSLARRIRRGSRTCHYKMIHTLFTCAFVNQRFFFSSGKHGGER